MISFELSPRNFEFTKQDVLLLASIKYYAQIYEASNSNSFSRVRKRIRSILGDEESNDRIKAGYQEKKRNG